MYKFLILIALLISTQVSQVSANSEFNHGKSAVTSDYYGRVYDRRGGGRGGDRGDRGRGDHRGRQHRGYRDGRIANPVRIHLGPAPYGGWRGHPYYWNGYNHYVWAWGPWAPWWGWAPYYGWRVGLYYYVPEGLKCFADNPQVPGEWAGQEMFYSSEDSINSALGFCESDPNVQNAGAQASCRIRECVRW